MPRSDAELNFHVLDEPPASYRERLRPPSVARGRAASERLCDPLAVCFLKAPHLRKPAYSAQDHQIDHRIALARLLDLAIAAVSPLGGVPSYAGAHHVQVDVDQTVLQVLVGFDRRCTIAVLPEGARAPFAPVVLLCGRPCDQLHALGNDVLAGILYQQVNGDEDQSLLRALPEVVD